MPQYRSPQQVWRENQALSKQVPEAPSEFNDLVYRFPEGQGPKLPPNAPGIGSQIKDQVINMGKGYLADQGSKVILEQAGVGAADVGGYLAAAKGLYSGGRILASDADNKDKAKALTETGISAGESYYTAGLSDVAKMADKKLLGGKLSALRAKTDKYNMAKLGINETLEASLNFGDSLWGSSKGKDQVSRDAVRSMLQKNKFFGEGGDDYSLDNADGTSFDIGKDGGARLEGDRKYYDIDPSSQNPIQGQAIGAVNPLAYLITGGNEKLATNFAGYFTNTVMQGAGGEDYAVTNANALDKYKKAGFDTAEKAIAGIDDLVKAGKLDPEKAEAFKGGINTVFGKIPSSDTRGSSVQSNSSGPKKGDGKRRRPENSYQPPAAAPPQVFAPTTTAPMGTSSTYGDGFAQSLANIYASNQGLT